MCAYWTIEAIARGEIERCESLLSNLKGLRELSQRVADHAKLISEQLDVCPTAAQPAEFVSMPPRLPTRVNIRYLDPRNRNRAHARFNK